MEDLALRNSLHNMSMIKILVSLPYFNPTLVVLINNCRSHIS
jgi:hypothetical protein